MNRIPVTIITGFLGSGKTTLLNHILNENHITKKKRIAVIENEFAAAFGIENEILHQDKIADIQNLYEFGMGCVCCSSSGELINALVEIVMRNDHEPKEKSIQHVILETTGLADPTPILELVSKGVDKQGTDDIVKNYYVNGIVTLIDVKHFKQSLEQQQTSNFKNELIAQILTTDLIILNKIDLLQDKENELNEIKSFILKYNKNVKIINTSFAELPSFNDIFDLRLDDNNSIIQTIAKEEAIKKHDPSIEQTMVIASGGYVDQSLVKDFVTRITASNNIYRVKGVLYLKENTSTKFILQGVGNDQLTIKQGNNWQVDEVKESRITFIGKNVLAKCNELEQEFKKCLLL